jgi:ABC-2 type transport system permease protein
VVGDIVTVARKEWTEYLLQGGGGRSGLARLGIVSLIGVMLARQMGPQFGSSWKTALLSAYMAVTATLSVVPDSFAGERERHTLETLLASRLSDRSILLGKVAASVSYALLFSLVVLVIGLLTANLGSGRGVLPRVRAEVMLGAVAASILVGSLMTGIGVLISLRAPTVKQAAQYMSWGFLLVVFVPLFGTRLVPSGLRSRIGPWLAELGATKAALVVAAAIALVDLLLLALALARFQRARLITE